VRATSKVVQVKEVEPEKTIRTRMTHAEATGNRPKVRVTAPYARAIILPFARTTKCTKPIILPPVVYEGRRAKAFPNTPADQGNNMEDLCHTEKSPPDKEVNAAAQKLSRETKVVEEHEMVKQIMPRIQPTLSASDYPSFDSYFVPSIPTAPERESTDSNFEYDQQEQQLSPVAIRTHYSDAKNRRSKEKAVLPQRHTATEKASRKFRDASSSSDEQQGYLKVSKKKETDDVSRHDPHHTRRGEKRLISSTPLNSSSEEEMHYPEESKHHRNPERKKAAVGGRIQFKPRTTPRSSQSEGRSQIDNNYGDDERDDNVSDE
jgi:hypothetical protein